MRLLTLRKLHKWVALFVGLQLLLWTASGLMFAWLDHHDVSGEHLVEAPVSANLDSRMPLTDPGVWRRQYAGRGVHEVTLQLLNDTWVYRIAHGGGIELRRADDGAPFTVDASVAERLALDHYRGTGRLVEVRHHPESTLESRGAGATWQARFDDAAQTSLYFSASDGSLVATRTDGWRVFDFFWMLHTMDYSGRDNFNNPLVILAGSSALWVVLTGVLLLTRVFRWKVPSLRRSAEVSRP